MSDFNFPDIEGPDDYQNFWERLGLDGGGLPKHFPMGVNRRGQGPDHPAHHYVCWCGDDKCPLTVALQDARAVGVSNLRIDFDQTQERKRRERGTW